MTSAPAAKRPDRALDPADPTVSGDLWTARPWIHPNQRVAAGRAARKRIPRASHAGFEPVVGRDPIAILHAQEMDRLPELVPLRHQRMAASAFAYYRGTPAVMAFDLAATPRTDIVVQAGGDAHLSNFGLFGSPERALVFDANDFDETLPGPWEWDVKRLATSIVIAGRANGFSRAKVREAALGTVRSYRRWMERYGAMRLRDVWYSTITDDAIRDAAEQTNLLRGKASTAHREAIDAVFSKARRKDGTRAIRSLTALVDGRRVIVDDPPSIAHVATDLDQDAIQRFFTDYRATLAENRRDFLDRFRFADAARKVVGVGSVGTRCWIVVLEGRDEKDPLILQLKEATASVLEPFLAPSRHANHAERVVVGQRLMQATPDILLGWTRSPEGRDFYFRQLWDMKGSVEPTTLSPGGLKFYGGLCAWALARAHARGGDAVEIAAYLGSSDTFDGAIGDFAEAYADGNARDHTAYLAAIEAGHVAIEANA